MDEVRKKILIISPECFPKVKVGGLGQATAGLYKGLRENDIDVRLVSPNDNIYFPLSSIEAEEKNRELGRKAVDLCIDNSWYPDWVWAHDWGGVWSLDEYKKVDWSTKLMWTIHSPVSLNGYGYSYGGYGNYGYMGGENNGEAIDWGDDFFDFASLVKKGRKVTDKTTTVSKSFAKVINGNELFCGRDKVIGINNGIDLDRWKVCLKGDRLCDFKRRNKRKIQKMFGLPVRNVPVFVFVSRMVSQKGLDLLLDVLPKFTAKNDVQFVFLGGGRKRYIKKIEFMCSKYPEKIAAKLEADFEMPKYLYSGADFLVLPSVSEPFGLVVAEAKRYGVIPIVYLIDGLKDQVRNGVDGFGFCQYTKMALEEKLMEAVGSFGSDWQYELSSRIGEDVSGWKSVSREWIGLLKQEDDKKR